MPTSVVTNEATSSSFSSSPVQTATADGRQSAPLIVRPIMTDFWSDERSDKEDDANESVDSPEEVRLAPGALARLQFAAPEPGEPGVAPLTDSDPASFTTTLISGDSEHVVDVSQTINVSAQVQLASNSEVNVAPAGDDQLSKESDQSVDVLTGAAALESTPSPGILEVASSETQDESTRVPMQLENTVRHLTPSSVTVDTLALSDADEVEDDEEIVIPQIDTDDVDDVIRIHLTFTDDEVSKIKIVGTGDDAQEWINAAAEAERQTQKRMNKTKKKKKKKKK